MTKKTLSKEELNASIEKARTEIRQGENLVRQLSKQCNRQERNARTRRLIERGAIAESLIPGAADLTNAQFKAVLSAGLSADAAREVLRGFAQSDADTARAG
jgi:hypothetical protein